MLGENKNLKDTSQNSIKDTSFNPVSNTNKSNSLVSPLRDYSVYYTKTNKLITALYMVTDTMEKEEPMRLKLRTLGIEILSDMSTTKTPLDVEKINQILSFLNIASDIRMISEMNCNILRKEFVELKQSIQKFTTQDHLWLEEFIGGPLEINSSIGHLESNNQTEKSFNKGQAGTRIGVQKGSTLMKALSKIGGDPTLRSFSEDREILKNKRRELISKIIKARPSSNVDKPNGVSIKDISLAIQNLGEQMGEKTLQRELISMVKDNVLKKTGEKRWSLYFLN